MQITRRQAIKGLVVLSAAATGLSAGKGHAASKKAPITLYVGFPPGGIPDIVARALAARLQDYLDRSVVVVNRTGAGGQLAIQAIKNARPDGLSYALTTPAPLTVLPHLHKNLPYDVERDLVPVSGVCTYFSALAVNKDIPVATFSEFVQWCKENPERATYGVPGIGTTLQFAGELLSAATGMPLRVVPYKGGPALTQAVVSGEISSSLNLSNNFTPLYEAGRIKLLAVSSKTRLADLPNVPTFGELGLEDVVIPEWMGVVGNAKAPAQEAATVATAVQQALIHKSFQDTLARQQCQALVKDSQAFGTLVEGTSERWRKHIKDTGFKLAS